MGSPGLRRELAGTALTLLAVFLIGALLWQALPADSCSSAQGAFGPAGACLRSWMVGTVGLPGALLLALIPLVHGIRAFRHAADEPGRHWTMLVAGLALLLPVALALAIGADRQRHAPPVPNAFTR